MASVTDFVKEGLKYPFNDWKKVLMLGVIFLVSSLVSFFVEYTIYDSYLILDNVASFNSFNTFISSLPPSNVLLIVGGWIVTFIIMLLISGYLYNVIKYSIEKRYELPGFFDIKGMLLNGIRVFIVGLAYAIIPILLFLFGLMLLVNESVGATVNNIGLAVLLISCLVGIFFYFVQVMAVSHMVANDELKAAFRFSEIFDLISNVGWGRFIGALLFTFVVIAVLSIFIEVIFGAVAFAASIIVGSALVLALVKVILECLFLNPYTSVAISRIYGSLYNEAKIE